MTRYIELLDRLKREQELPSDYAAHKLLGIDQARLHDYRHGKATPDTYACTRLAVELGLDPLTLIAEIEKDAEKNPKRRGWWQDFFYAATRKNGTLVLICAIFCAAELQNGESYANSLNEKAHYTKRWFQRLFRSPTYWTSWQCY